MALALIVSIRLYDDRYHGASEWPPAPGRLFQALVAGAGLSGPLESTDRQALVWLENLNPPVVAAPRKRDGHTVTLYVPNNDLDSVAGDLRRISEIRGSQKVIKPRLLQAACPFKYAWTFEESEDSERQAPLICVLAERLYQFGRGVDFACAWGEEVDAAKMEDQLLDYPGAIHRPSSLGSGLALRCPAPGSLKSLQVRHSESGRRFHVQQKGRLTTQTFTKSPVPRFASISYDSPTRRFILELRELSGEGSFVTWPMVGITRLVGLLRDGAVARLTSALPSQLAEIEQILVGRKPESSEGNAPSKRIRILPLPSIGHHHADRDIRRVVIDVPQGCILSTGDLQWAFSGLELANTNSVEGNVILIVPGSVESSGGMLAHYGIGDHDGHSRWRTVTPAALPDSAARRRIDPKRRLAEVKGGHERASECARAGGAIVQALRHAGVQARAQSIRVQREPFESSGERAEMFAETTRFSKHQLWHVEIEFANKISGPLTIGDGRFLGLGLLAPT